MANSGLQLRFCCRNSEQICRCRSWDLRFAFGSMHNLWIQGRCRRRMPKRTFMLLAWLSSLLSLSWSSWGGLWEHAMWSRTEEILQAKFSLEESKSLWQAARGLLSGMCDADLEIDSELQILSSSDKFSHLLMCSLSPGSKALEGMPFTNYLHEPDQPRFEEFIEAACHQSLHSMSSASVEGSFSKPSSWKCTPAASLHVHIRGAAGLKFAAEIYHVAIPTLSDSTKFRHLLGINEGESQRWGTSIASADCASEILNDMSLKHSAAATSARSPDLLPLGANFKPLLPFDAWSASKSSASSSSSRA
ncbi:unnamed protein product [Polarella glacialis]|uniref:Uncharacterized protein n=1 Tax=Polarella glacialis TaxID=89957 RepID=A0A813F075_POLGL|nr:unnamed protein product [Polarella glacialis]